MKMQKLKTTRKNIGYYHIELNGRKWEVSQTEDGKEWNVGEMSNDYGSWGPASSYDETFGTLRDCKHYITEVA